MKEDENALLGSHSHDLSLVGSIAPLLFVSNSKVEFLSNVECYIAFTHNNETVLSVAKLFATVLYDVSEGASIQDALANMTVDKAIQDAFNAGVGSKDKDTLMCIQEFGPGCSVEGAFEGTLHLLVSYDNFKEAMIANSKSGGDSSCRGMIVGMLMGAAGCEIPPSWKKAAKY